MSISDSVKQDACNREYLGCAGMNKSFISLLSVVCVETKGRCQGASSIAVHSYSLRQGLLLPSEHAVLTKLAVKRATGIYLFPSSTLSTGVTDVHPNASVLYEDWESELRSSYLQSRSFSR